MKSFRGMEPSCQRKPSPSTQTSKSLSSWCGRVSPPFGRTDARKLGRQATAYGCGTVQSGGVTSGGWGSVDEPAPLYALQACGAVIPSRHVSPVVRVVIKLQRRLWIFVARGHRRERPSRFGALEELALVSGGRILHA